MHDAQEFELDALISGDEDESHEDIRDEEKGSARRRGNSGAGSGSESSGMAGGDEGRLRLS